jgi:methylmalonyl-CoA mutase
LGGANTFVALLDATEHASLGQVTRTLYEVGGEYRRNL